MKVLSNYNYKPLFSFLLIYLLINSFAFSQVTISGGGVANLCNTYQTLSDIVVSETSSDTAIGDILPISGAGTITFSLPAGLEFEDNIGFVSNSANADDISSLSISVDPTVITITLSFDNNSPTATDVITISGLRVRSVSAGNGSYSLIRGGTLTLAGTVTETSSSIVVAPPSVDAGSGVSICLGGAGTSLNAIVTGGTAPLTYTWLPTSGLSSTTISNPTANPLVTTTYVVSASDANGCQTSDFVTVTVDSPASIRR